jgi:16S rRNA (guanine527-N7)-methyltransferase
VKQIEDLKRLASFLESQDIKVDSSVEERLKLYLKMLFTWSMKMNLVSANDIELLVNRHFFASFYYVYALKNILRQGQNLLDLGTGAGFPGIIISIYFPEHQVFLLDSSRKKTLFLRKTKDALSLNCEITNQRAENLRPENFQQFDYVLARAVASMQKLSEWSGPLLKRTGSLITIKGAEEDVGVDQEKYMISSHQINVSWLKFSDYFENKKLYKMELV